MDNLTQSKHSIAVMEAKTAFFIWMETLKNSDRDAEIKAYAEYESKKIRVATLRASKTNNSLGVSVLERKEKIFRKGLQYVFTYKKYKQSCRKKGIKPLHWAKEMNGQAVVLYSYGGAKIKGNSIRRSWCKCIGRKVEHES